MMAASRGPLGRLFFARGLKRRLEQFPDLRVGQHEREFFLELGQEDFLERIHFQSEALREEFVKTSQCGKSHPDVAPGTAGLHLVEEIGPEIVRRALLPWWKALARPKMSQRVGVTPHSAGRGVLFRLEMLEKTLDVMILGRTTRHCFNKPRPSPARQAFSAPALTLESARRLLNVAMRTFAPGVVIAAFLLCSIITRAESSLPVPLHETRVVTIVREEAVGEDTAVPVAIDPPEVLAVLSEPVFLKGEKQAYLRVRGEKPAPAAVTVDGRTIPIVVVENGSPAREKLERPIVTWPAEEAVCWRKVDVGVEVFADRERGIGLGEATLEVSDGQVLKPVETWEALDGPFRRW